VRPCKTLVAPPFAGMHRREVPVRSPCSQSIAEMARVGEGVRWCSSCEHEVHDLGELDEDRARRLLDEHRGRSLCVRYATDSAGHLRFASPTLPANRLTRRPRLSGFALAATVSLVMIAGCASTSASKRKPTDPITEADPWAVTVNFEVDPEQGVWTGVVYIDQEDRFVDPLVFELEDAIIPESIAKSRNR
jgi:hypothetical protein